MRQKGYQECSQGRSKPDILPERTKVAACVDAGAARHDGSENREQRRQANRQYDKGGPDQCAVARQPPPGQQGRDPRGRRQRPPQIVQHFPQADQRQAAAAPHGARRIASSQDPRQQLPVAACPAVLPCGSDVISRRKFLDDLDIGNQTRARKDSLEEVVTEQRAVGYTTGERGFKGIHIVDALAGVRAFAEEILVDIRHGGGIRIDPARAREDALKERAFAADRQGRRDPRLQHGVSLDHVSGCGVEPGVVQRVGHLSDQAACRFPRQPGVGIERNDVADARRNLKGTPIDVAEVRIGRSAQQPIQLVELPPLAFPSHPLPLHGAPDAAAVEQEETVTCGTLAVKPVQSCNGLARHREKLLISGNIFGRGVCPVRQQRKIQLAFRRGEVVNLEPLDLLFDCGASGEQRGYDHQRSQMRWNTFAQRETGQDRCAEAPHDGTIQERDGGIERRNDAEESEQREIGNRDAPRVEQK